MPSIPPQDRYEDYVVNDLTSDVESRFAVALGRSNRAIVDISMGGFGAVKLALRHPDLFRVVGGIRSAIDVPRRAFSIKRLQQSRHYDAIFGPAGSQTRRGNDPSVLLRTENPEAAPYFFLTCGEQEGLLPAIREFAKLSGSTSFSIRVPYYPRLARLEPMECLASQLISKPDQSHSQDLVIERRPGPVGRRSRRNQHQS